MYEGFDFNKQQEYEQFMVDKGILTHHEIKESWDNVRHWKKNNWEQHNKECTELNEALVNAINNQMKPDSQEVQDLIQRHYAWENSSGHQQEKVILVLEQCILIIKISLVFIMHIIRI